MLLCILSRRALPRLLLHALRHLLYLLDWNVFTPREASNGALRLILRREAHMRLALAAPKARDEVDVAQNLAVLAEPLAQCRHVSVRRLVQDRDAPVVLRGTRGGNALLDDAGGRHARVELDHARESAVKRLPLLLSALRADPVLRQARMAVGTRESKSCGMIINKEIGAGDVHNAQTPVRATRKRTPKTEQAARQRLPGS